MARVTTARKWVASFSYRVATRRHSLSHSMHRSTTLLPLNLALLNRQVAPKSQPVPPMAWPSKTSMTERGLSPRLSLRPPGGWPRSLKPCHRGFGPARPRCRNAAARPPRRSGRSPPAPRFIAASRDFPAPPSQAPASQDFDAAPHPPARIRPVTHLRKRPGNPA